MYFGSTVLRTSIKKIKNSTINDYTQIKVMIAGFESGKFVRPNLETLIGEVVNRRLKTMLIRPSTPFESYTEHQVVSPSESAGDQMILPTMSC